jgi:hypothetical protein
MAAPKGGRFGLQVLSACERQAALAVKQSAKPPVTRAALAPDNTRSDFLAQLAAPAATFKPVLPAHHLIHRYRGGFWL